MVNKKNMRTFISALRSGEYKQGRHYLKQNSESGPLHCCLGVAEECRIKSVKYGPKKWNLYQKLAFGLGKGEEEVFGVLSSSGMKWLGLDNVNPDLKIPDHLLERLIVKHVNYTAAQLNDYCRFSFEEIADCFEFTYLS